MAKKNQKSSADAEKPELGRPPLFKSNEELKKAIEKYFKSGMKKKKIEVKRGNKSEVIEIEVPTITGLALFLGFESRQSFYDYEKSGVFSYTIKKARLTIEQNYEELLQTSAPTGAIFALKNFGWIDTKQIDIADRRKGIDELYPNTDEITEEE